jgi:hypothetical protein
MNEPMVPQKQEETGDDDAWWSVAGSSRQVKIRIDATTTLLLSVFHHLNREKPWC